MKGKDDLHKLFIKGISFVFWGFVLLVLGFLPSFIFIALFIQYGSPFSNYINFLFNFAESWIAWISAIVIILLFISVGKSVKTIREMKKSKKKKITWVIIAFSMIFIVGLIGWQLYLYINFVLGNDILIKIIPDNDNFFFENSNDDEVNFKISVTMNPFCVAECEYEFFDLSQGEVIESGAFNIASIFSRTKTYILNKSDVDPGSQNLNQFKVSCKSQKTILCFTKEKENKKTVLISLNNVFSDEEKRVLDNYKNKIISLKQIFYLSENAFAELKNNINSINGSFSYSDYPLSLLETKFVELDNSFDNLQKLWRLQELDSLKFQVPELEGELFDFYNLVGIYNKNLSRDFSIYNNLTEKIRISKQILEGIKSKSLPDWLCLNLNQTIFDFNNAVFNFENENRLFVKEKIIGDLYSEILILSELANGGFGDSFCDVVNLTEKSFEKIIYFYLDESIPKVVLDEPLSSCCYLGDCEKCCDDSCSDKYYPVIFLHGHSINGALPADYSFDSFMEIKNELTKKDYIDVGDFVMSENEVTGLWGRVNVPIMVTASYFFDVYKTSSGKVVSVSSKTDGIDTYAIRLRNIINSVKERTGKEKVIVIAHSMGGVVTRRYVQIFGGEDVDKIILVCVPNHGISDKVKDYCAVLGSETACNDMDEDSILMNHLNNDETDFVEIHNIVGIGCNMGDETGDGIVKNSSQYLSDAKNYYINGTCNELNFDFFHESILFPNLYPDAYNIIKKLLV
jgi:hypothetical protein